MYLTFPNLNSIHLIIKQKDIGFYVLFRTFHDNFQVKLFPPKNIHGCLSPKSQHSVVKKKT